MVSIFLPPIQNQEKSEQRPSQVGKVSHIVVTAIRDSHKELNQSVSDDKIFGFDRNRYKHEIQGSIGEKHAESQQNTEYGVLSSRARPAALRPAGVAVMVADCGFNRNRYAVERINIR